MLILRLAILGGNDHTKPNTSKNYLPSLNHYQLQIYKIKITFPTPLSEKSAKFIRVDHQTAFDQAIVLHQRLTIAHKHQLKQTRLDPAPKSNNFR